MVSSVTRGVDHLRGCDQPSRVGQFGIVVLSWSMLQLGACRPFVDAVQNIRIVSPLQVFTVWDQDRNDGPQSPREKFLPRFKAGLEAEAKVKKESMEISTKQKKEITTSGAAAAGRKAPVSSVSKTSSNLNWARQAAWHERQQRVQVEKQMDEAFDQAVSRYDRESASASAVSSVSANTNKQTTKDDCAYQFVGVIQPSTRKTISAPIKWYARKKPTHAKWTVRLVHANRDAIIKDLFDQGKVDILAKYRNTGRRRDTETNTPIVTSEYIVRERSVKNLWNFSLKHLFTDSSGMYWRERRLRPGLYTDGAHVYEATYRYEDGRNGMHRLSTFGQYMNSKSVSLPQKQRILLRLSKDAPDIVLEE